MYRAVEQHGDENAQVIAANPAFSAAFERFKTNIAAIESLAQQNDARLTGIAEDKNALKQALARQAAEIAGVVFAYASANADHALKQEANFSYSALLKTRDGEIAARCRSIHDLAAARLEALKDYGIRAPNLTRLQTAIDAYAAHSPKPRTAASQRKTALANLTELFKETDQILRDQMDKLIATFNPAHPDFVKTYESNRIIIDPPSKAATPPQKSLINPNENKPA